MHSAVQPRPWRSRLVAGLAVVGITLSGLLASTGVAQAAPVQAAGPVTPLAADASDFKALVFSKTAGFRHDSIPTAVAKIQSLGVENNFEVDTTEDGASFTDANLEQYDVVIWVSTTGDVLNTDQQAAFERYIEAGGGYAGVHAASDTEYDWPWYGQLVGAYFQGHPAPQDATVKVEDHAHASTEHLGDTWDRFDEWYSFRTNPRTASDAHVLLSLDETTYDGGTMGEDHPIAWCKNYEGGRSWYTGGGHTIESYSEPAFVEHLLKGIQTAAGVVDSDCNASQSASYQLVPLDTNTSNPMAMDIAADGTVFYIDRNGKVQRNDGVTSQTTTALTLDVNLSAEDGLLGIALDPDFATNNWGYFYWSPSNTILGSGNSENRISRFTYDPAAKTFALSSEKVVLKIPTQRAECCHAGGDMLFDNEGNLVLATGDNTNPFASDGYAPIDEQAGRSSWDAQRSSANTNDLRGKVVRITPQDDGTYTVPAGNLFAPGTAKTKPEIYAMGFRNPFRIGLDPYTNNLLVADYGPDAGGANANRGPGGTVEWNILDEPGNYGWPLCVGDECYNDYNFATQQSGAKFNPAAPVNNSPNNTGLTTLPPVIQPEWFGENGTTPQFAEVGNSGAPMGGPVYKYDETLDSDVKWPEYWDGKAFFGDWNNGKMFTFQLNEDETDAPRGTQIVDANRLLPKILDPNATPTFKRTMDFDFGPNGALYVIDWGSGFGGDNADSGIYRIDYVQADPSPLARASADVTNGVGPLTVQFSSEGTRHPTGRPTTLSWDFGDGSAPTADANPTHTYAANGSYTATLTVTDDNGKEGIANVVIVVGNQLPTVNITFPENGGFFEWGDDVAYKVTVNDPDGTGEIDCSKVQVLPALGHDSHQHPMGEFHGCEGSIPTQRDGGHGLEANLFWVVDVRYTDDGGAAGIPLTGYGVNILNPKHFEAEYYDKTGRINGTGGQDDGVRTEGTGDSAGGGRNVSNVEVGDWWSYEPVNFKGIDGITMRLAKGFAGDGKIELRWNSPTGPKLGEVTFQPSPDGNGNPGWQVYKDFTVPLTDLPTETGELYFVLTQGGVNVNYIEWEGDGVDANSPPTATLTTDETSGPTPLVVNATATGADPEGTAVTYQWRQGTGDEFTAGEATKQFTYETPGVYQLTVRVTDADGSYTDKGVTITVNSPGSAACLTGRSDGFDGTVLDNARWNRIVRPSQDARVEDGSLVIPASKTDIYGAGAGNVPNIVLQDLPEGAWQATTKVTFPARVQYQQAGLVVYGDDENYAKMVIQGRAGSTDAAQRVFQFIREEAGTPNEVAASNTPNLGAGFPDTYYVRFTSNGTNLNASYSADGVTFTQMSETKSLAGIVNPKIGLISFANSGSPDAVIDAKFDYFHITPDDTAVADGPDDQFEGTSLDACRWTVVNEQPEGYRVAGGSLQIDTTTADIYGGDTGVPNFIVQDQPEGDSWVVETKVDASELDRQYQQGGLILYGDDNNYVKLDILATNQGGSAIARNVEMRSEIAGVVQNPQPNATAPSNGIVWLRLAKDGDVYTGWSSADGENWTQIQDKLTNASLGGARIGLYALGNSAQGQVSNTAKFDYFEVVGNDPEPVELTATLNPAAPNGQGGWYTAPVTLTLDTTGGEGVVYREYNLDGSGFLEYTAPVVVSADGSHTIGYRATGAEAGEVSFKIDATVPTATATLTTTDAERKVTIAGADAGSGVAALEYRLAGAEAWQAYPTDGIVVDETAQTVEYRVRDAAGNQSATLTLSVPELPEEEPVLGVNVTLEPAQPGATGWFTSAVTVSATATTTGETAATVEISTDGTVWTALTEPRVISTQGTSKVWLRATDGEHTSAAVERELKIDTVKPTAAATVEARTATLTATDVTSGVDKIEYRLGETGSWAPYSQAVTVPGSDAATVQFRATDKAGNVSEIGSAAIAAVVSPDPTPAVVVDDTSVTQGQVITVTGTGFEPGAQAEIWLYSTPILVGTVTVGDNGGFSFAFQVPAGFEPGQHHVVVLVDGVEQARSAAITVTAVAVDPGNPGATPGGGNPITGGPVRGNLPATGGGSEWDTMLPLGIIFLIAGAGSILIARTKRKAAADQA